MVYLIVNGWLIGQYFYYQINIANYIWWRTSGKQLMSFDQLSRTTTSSEVFLMKMRPSYVQQSLMSFCRFMSRAFLYIEALDFVRSSLMNTLGKSASPLSFFRALTIAVFLECVVNFTIIGRGLVAESRPIRWHPRISHGWIWTPSFFSIRLFTLVWVSTGIDRIGASLGVESAGVATGLDSATPMIRIECRLPYCSRLSMRSSNFWIFMSRSASSCSCFTSSITPIKLT